MRTDAALAADAGAPVVAPLLIDVVSDVVCPWCFIGKRKLETALESLRGEEGLEIKVRWHPFELNPELPAQGVPRDEYLRAKFGGNGRASEIYARVRAVGAQVGIDFDFERIELQPNTHDAHRLIAWAQQQGDASVLVERLFRAYFIEGRFLGAVDDLVTLAADAGFAADAARTMLLSSAYRAEVEAEYREAQGAGITGVPFFIFNGGTAIFGAHDPETLLEAITAARRNA